jgi:hypothetical protein
MVSHNKTLETEKNRLIADYEWLRRMMCLLDFQTEQLDRQLVEIEKLLPDDYVHPDEARLASGLTRSRKTAQ